MTGNATLSLSCADRPGLVAQVAGLLAARGGNIHDAQQFNDQETQRFFMRVIFAAHANDDTASLRVDFAAIAAELRMAWKLCGPTDRQRVLAEAVQAHLGIACS